MEPQRAECPHLFPTPLSVMSYWELGIMLIASQKSANVTNQGCHPTPTTGKLVFEHVSAHGISHLESSNVKSLGEYSIIGLPGSTEGSLEVHSHGFKVTKVSIGVCVCVFLQSCLTVQVRLWDD